MRAIPLYGLLLLGSPAFASVADCPAPATVVTSATPAGTAPLSTELAFEPRPLGAPAGVLSQAFEASLSVDRVLLRQQVARCNELAKAIPAPGVDSTDPAAYKPRTQYDNTPWRFNMSQNGKKMTADEFSAWMESRGVRVARGAATPASALPPPAPQEPAVQPVDAQSAPQEPAAQPQPVDGALTPQGPATQPVDSPPEP